MKVLQLETTNPGRTPNVVWHHGVIDRSMRERRNGHRAAVVWLTGLSGAGKSTLAHAVEARLHAARITSYVLDGDNVRHGLCADLGFDEAARAENVRRAAEVAKLFVDAGTLVLTAFISPFARDRQTARKLVGADDFVEIYCRCPLEICEGRDPKGLYRKARAGGIQGFTGVSSRYEEPRAADMILDMTQPLETCTAAVLSLLGCRGFMTENVHSVAV
jgi:adenylylsulfate kinase